ncbi:CPBP family intramembrane metalloprotease, partial [Candidatus Saccharibacteria bacterium]|nr:CPBP family intramembrane metalloprotease [Candidatus Saccharibacteria bacterium]
SKKFFALVTVLTATAIYFVGQFVAAFVYLALTKNQQVDQLEPWQTTVISLAFGATILACIYLILRRHAKTLAAMAHKLGIRKPTKETFTYALLGFSAYFVIFLTISIVLSHFQLVDLEQAQKTGFENVSQHSLDIVYAFLTLVIIPPFVEEVLFRGFLFRRLKGLVGVVAAALITSVLFGVAHWQWNVAIDTFVLSMVMIYVLQIHDNLVVTMLMHMLKNILAFLVIFHV